MDETSALVERQYEKYPYPEPIFDIAEHIAKGYLDTSDPSLASVQFWPEGRPRRDLDILVAGCGTNQAARLAFTNPQCRVTGIDLSEQSLEHERFLMAKHGLNNLNLIKMNVSDVDQLGRKFDFIVCTGVLHHLQNPGDGLHALGSILAIPHGVIYAMVYGYARRIGLYLLQDVFRRLRVRQDENGIAIVREVLSQLPRHHYLHWYAIDLQKRLENDALIVDSFLHPQDRAYSVPQVLSLVEQSGLVFQGWEDNYLYFPDATVHQKSKIFPLLQKLPEHEQWAIVENLIIASRAHSFIACRPERDQKHYRLNLNDPEWLKYYPVRHFAVRAIVENDDTPTTTRTFVRDQIKMELSQAEAFFLRLANGHMQIEAILNHKALAGSLQERESFARQFYGAMWRRGHMFFSRMPVQNSVDIR